MDADRRGASPGSLWDGGTEVGMVSGPAHVLPQESEHRRRQQKQQLNLVSCPVWPHPSPQWGSCSPLPPRRGGGGYVLCPCITELTVPFSPVAGAGVLPGAGGIPGVGGVVPGVGVVPGAGGEAMAGLGTGAWGGSRPPIPHP